VSTDFFLIASFFFGFCQLLSQRWGSTFCGAQLWNVMEPEVLGNTHSIPYNITYDRRVILGGDVRANIKKKKITGPILKGAHGCTSD